MKFEVFKSKSYWYGFYMNTVRPVLLEYVQDTEEVKWDDALLEAFDYIADVLLKPE